MLRKKREKSMETEISEPVTAEVGNASLQNFADAMAVRMFGKCARCTKISYVSSASTYLFSVEILPEILTDSCKVYFVTAEKGALRDLMRANRDCVCTTTK